MDIAFV